MARAETSVEWVGNEGPWPTRSRVLRIVGFGFSAAISVFAALDFLGRSTSQTDDYVVFALFVAGAGCGIAAGSFVESRPILRAVGLSPTGVILRFPFRERRYDWTDVYWYGPTKIALREERTGTRHVLLTATQADAVERFLPGRN